MIDMMKTKYFMGNEISSYGQAHNRVDYATLAKSFDAVLNNYIINHGEWELIQGGCYRDYKENEYSIDERYEKVEELEELIATEEAKENPNEELISEWQLDLDCLEYEAYAEIYQYYIISESGARILQEYTNEIVYYNEEFDMYLWGVTHYGTSWIHVLTNIKIDTEEN